MTRTKDDLQKIVASGRGGIGRRRLGWAAAFTALAVGAWLLGAAGGPELPARYETDLVRRSDIVVTVTATGTVEPKNTVEISSELSGSVRVVNVDFNDLVKVGQPLAELDKASFEAMVARSKATVAGSEARLAEAVATLDQEKQEAERTALLTTQGIGTGEEAVVAEAELRRAQASVDAAAADLAVSRADLALDQADLANTCICSPIDGVVLDRSVEVGQIVAASLSAPVLFTLAEDLESMELLVDIDEADIGLVSAGDVATFSVEAYQDRVFPAVISEVRYASETVDGVVTYKAVLDIDNADLLLRPGMTAVAEITVAKVAGALTVPNAALRYAPPAALPADDEGGGSGLLGLLISPPPDGRVDPDPPEGRDGRRTIYLLQNGQPVPTPVRTGATDGTVTEILEGEIAPGDVVVISEAPVT